MFWSFKEIQRKIDLITHNMHRHSIESEKRLDKIEKVLVKQEANLQEHMKRSDHLEEMVTTMKKDDIDPVKKHVNMIEGVFKFLGIFGLVVSIVGGLARLFNVI